MDPDLYKAAMWDNVQFLRHLIGEDPCILQTSTPQADTALHIAARSGHENIAKEILRADNTLLASQNAEGDTPLHIAARAGHKEIVSLLLDDKNWPADIESQQKLLRMTNNQGNTPLHEAVKSRIDEIVSKLLDADPSARCILNDNKETPLHMAAGAGLDGIAKNIVKYPWVKEEELELSPTPLHLAVLGGHIRMMELLLEQRRGLIKVKDRFGNNALHYAALKNHGKIVGMLLRKERSLAYLKNNDSLFPIHVAATHDSANAIKEILSYCPDAAEEVDSTGKNALHIAVIHQKIEVLRCLLDKIVPVKIINQGDKDGNTPLHLAVMQRRKYAALELLRDRRVDPCVKNMRRCTPREEIEQREHDLEVYEVYIWEMLAGLEAKKLKKEYAEIDVPRLIKEAIYTQEKTTKRDMKEKIAWEPDEQFKLSVQTYTLVAALIATVAFAATFAVPGGFDQKYGHAILADQVAFKIFMISDTVAMCSSVIVVFCFMWAWKKDKVKIKLHQLRWGHMLTVVASLALIATFIAAVYLVVAPKSVWLAVTVIVLSCSTPFLVLAILGKDILAIPCVELMHRSGPSGPGQILEPMTVD